MGPANPYQSPQTDVTAPPAAGVDQTGPFDPKGRFGRLSYIAWYLTLTVAAYAVMLVVVLVLGAAGLMGAQSETAGGIVGGVGLILYVAFILAMLVIGIIFFIRRLHDIDLSGWWALLMLVPLVNAIFGIFALVKAGTAGANRFGPPRETRGWEQVVGIIGVVLFVLSLVVTIAAVVFMAMNPEMMGQ